MGTWGEGIWSNDQAADWAFGFDGADYEAGLAMLEDALETAPLNGALDDDGGPVFAAAAYVVALLRGWEPAQQVPYDADASAWARAHREDAAASDLPQRTAHAVERLLRDLLYEQGTIGALEREFDEIWDGDVELSQRALELKEIREALLES